MEEPGWAWPAWKFDMRRDDLFKSLHDQYNTVSFTLQDPEAFHHDVLELSSEADTAEQFHRLMAKRKTQRAREIRQCLETLACEITGNPMLVGTHQWEHAIQFFRTGSYDSIVRYFASYMPREEEEEEEVVVVDLSGSSDTSSCVDAALSHVDACSAARSKITDVDDVASQFCDEVVLGGPVMALESCAMGSTQELGSCYSEAVSSETCCSEAAPLDTCCSEAAPSETSDKSCYSSTHMTSRPISFSGSESGRLSSFLRNLTQDDDDASQSASGETAVESMCDSVETISSVDSTDDYKDTNSMPGTPEGDDWDIHDLPVQYLDDDAQDTLVYDSLDLKVHTPRQCSEPATYLEHPNKATVVRALSLGRCQSPKPHYGTRISTIASRTGSRRSPEEALSKIKKPTEAKKRRPLGKMSKV